MELYEAFDRAVASTAGIVETVRPDQADAPTPCTEWDVRDLLNHIIGTLWLSEALLSDQPPRHPMAPGGLPGTDLPGPALAGFTTLDILVHGWDLARATSQPTALDDILAAHVLAFAEQAITP